MCVGEIDVFLSVLLSDVGHMEITLNLSGGRMLQTGDCIFL